MACTDVGAALSRLESQETFTFDRLGFNGLRLCHMLTDMQGK